MAIMCSVGAGLSLASTALSGATARVAPTLGAPLFRPPTKMIQIQNKLNVLTIFLEMGDNDNIEGEVLSLGMRHPLVNASKTLWMSK